MHDQIHARLVNAYLRGFRAAVAGEASAPDALATTAYMRGYAAGQATFELAQHSAERFADEQLKQL